MERQKILSFVHRTGYERELTVDIVYFEKNHISWNIPVVLVSRNSSQSLIIINGSTPDISNMNSEFLFHSGFQITHDIKNQ